MDNKPKTYSIMKTKLKLQTAMALLILIAPMTTASAQPVPKHAPVVNPVTGLPAPGGAPLIDPITGLPLAPATPAEPQWIDPDWKDPDVVLTNVFYDGLPLAEVARDLRDRFKGYFDILPTPLTSDKDWGTETTIRLQLKNVRASEVFNAMNLVFENDRTPLRWELKLNGKRPTALLRVLGNILPKFDPTTGLPVPSVETKRMVFFVGDLLGDEKSGGMTMDQLIRTISEVHEMSFGSKAGLQFHKQAQLVIVNGTDEDISFIADILKALEQKVKMDAQRNAQSKPAESKPKSEATNTK
jgi:hypothetical protein